MRTTKEQIGKSSAIGCTAKSTQCACGSAVFYGATTIQHLTDRTVVDMSREIKFRAWHEDAKDMVWFGLGENLFHALNIETNERFTLDLTDGHPIMQYTGLKDNNGVEIYDGDILRGIAGNYVVIWSASELGCGWKKIRGGSVTDIGTGHESEVIGNIYETPELLSNGS